MLQALVTMTALKLALNYTLHSPCKSIDFFFFQKSNVLYLTVCMSLHADDATLVFMVGCSWSTQHITANQLLHNNLEHAY